MKTIDHVNFHINNGGVSFSVIDEGYGPTIKIEQSHFGAATSTITLKTDPESLKTLGEMLIGASTENFSETYCCAPQGKNKHQELQERSVMGQCCGGAPPA